MNADIEYKKLVEHVLTNGNRRNTRSGEVLSTFGYSYSLDVNPDVGFPLLTTKKIPFKSVYHELIWFLSGSTMLKDLKVPVLWKDWVDGSGELNECYGKQWRAWECAEGDWSWGEFNGYKTVDQISTLISKLKNDQYSRRLIVSAWNPGEVENASLPWCHALFQCYVEYIDGEGFLDLHLYQRSADIAIGLPFNISSYALLMYFLGQECNLTPRRFFHSLGDIHIYTSHLDKLIEQIERESKPLPYLTLSSKGFWERVEDDFLDDYILTGYDPHPFIKYELAV